jgi:hypothetical protein
MRNPLLSRYNEIVKIRKKQETENFSALYSEELSIVAYSVNFAIAQRIDNLHLELYEDEYVEGTYHGLMSTTIQKYNTDLDIIFALALNEQFKKRKTGGIQ